MKPKPPKPRGTVSGIPVWCRYDEAVDVTDLRKHPGNPNTHGDEQIALLSKIIKTQGWRNPIVVSTRSGYIVKGHGRLQAAQVLGVESVPVERQDYATDEAELEDLLADNRLAELSEMDPAKLKDLLQILDTGANDLDLTGYIQSVVEQMMTAAADVPDKPEQQGRVCPNCGAKV